MFAKLDLAQHSAMFVCLFAGCGLHGDLDPGRGPELVPGHADRGRHRHVHRHRLPGQHHLH